MDSKFLVLMAARACDEKKAKEIKVININKVSYISEWILIAEGLSDVQVRSITNVGNFINVNQFNLFGLFFITSFCRH